MSPRAAARLALASFFVALLTIPVGIFFPISLGFLGLTPAIVAWASGLLLGCITLYLILDGPEEKGAGWAKGAVVLSGIGPAVLALWYGVVKVREAATRTDIY